MTSESGTISGTISGTRRAGFFVGVELFFVRFMGERIGTGRSS